jgi:hypothetical protein
MAATTFDFRADDTLTVIRFTIFDKQTKQVIPLNGTHTANIVWSIDEAPSVSRAMTVLTGADDGKVEYQFQAGELIAGDMQIQVKITETASGKIATTINDVKKIVGPSL